MVWQKQYT